ncbi:P-loop NTPase family protein [Roseivirga misakiensis]|uniref:Orc1-like AAA ATPase domain-containing protein n=1 Tax=Roseivirga misakiensis TaxID=1563681 RepID=A0A1E5T1Y8_9BACT|nr:ATP-binding protein [Roseivirga misakiensis]OEK05392.1 hypothetical protein BFP71_18550 [Roseivirga misakiensis]
MKKYDINEIFTPSSPATHTFVDRPAINNLLVDAIRTRGKQLIIYGHSGTGKTTLLFNKLNQTYDDYIITRCTSDLSFNQLVSNAFDQLGTFFISKKTNHLSSSINSSLSTDYQLIKGSLGYSKSKNKFEEFQPIIAPQLTPQKLAAFFGSSNSCWVIDDFHKMEEDEKKKLAQYMKVFMDESVNYPYVKIVAIGAVGTAKEVLKLDNELNNRVSEIQVHFMSRDELKEIIAKGESRLNISITENVKDEIVKFSTGLPAVTHQLSYNLCTSKDLYETSEAHLTFNNDDFREALANYIITNSGYLHDRYEKAIDEPSEYHLPLCYHILRSFIISEKHNLSLNDVHSYFKKHKHPQQKALLEYLLQQLTHDKRGNALNYDIPSQTWFISDPFFRVYGICAMKLAQQDLQAQLDLFNKESIEKSKKKVKEEQRDMIKVALKSGFDFEF